MPSGTAETENCCPNALRSYRKKTPDVALQSCQSSVPEGFTENVEGKIKIFMTVKILKFKFIAV